MTRQANKTKARRRISPQSPRKMMKDQRRVELIEANIVSIAKHGLSDTTISHVSEAAGMSRGIINFYFDSKECMMLETLSYLLNEMQEQWDATLAKHAKASASKRLEALVQSCFSAQLCTRKKMVAWMAFMSHSASHTTYRQRIEQSLGQLRKEIVQLLAEISPESSRQAEALSQMVMAQIQGLWLSYVSYAYSSNKKELAALCLLTLQSAGYRFAELSTNSLTAQHMRVSRTKPKRGVSDYSKRKEDITLSQEPSPVVGDLFAELM